jgi:hypothetical protein
VLLIRYSQCRRNLLRQSRLRVLLSSLYLIGVWGCGHTRDENRLPVFPVLGQLLVKGKPAEGAHITLHPAGSLERKALPPGERKALPAQAIADSSGNFQLSTYVNHDGAQSGEYVVTVYWPAHRAAAKADASDDGDSQQLPPDRLQGRFASPTSSPLRATVGQTPLKLKPIDLGDKSVQAAKRTDLTAGATK